MEKVEVRQKCYDIRRNSGIKVLTVSPYRYDFDDGTYIKLSPFPKRWGPATPKNFSISVDVDNVSSLSFDGSNDYVDVGTMSGLTLDRFHIKCWVKTSATTVEDIFGTFNVGANTALRITINDGESGQLKMSVRDEDDNLLTAELSSAATFNDGAWHELDFIRDGDNSLIIKIDGSSQSLSYLFQQTPDNFAAFEYPLIIGAFNNRGTIQGFYTGLIDEVSVWNDASETSLIAKWKFDEESGTNALDSAGNNDGTISGATYSTDLPFENEFGASSWDTVTGADGYNVYVDTGSGFVKDNSSLITDTSYDIEDVGAGTHDAYVVSVLGSEESIKSNIESFTIS